MKKSSLVKQAVLATVVSVMAVAWLTAQDQPNDIPKTPRSTVKGSADVKKVNKCSQLIGMDVKNAAGEKIGKIEDVVIDFTSDKVGYVVLTTDKGPLSAEKYHAVPLRAFQTSPDGTSVTLNADKTKLANSEGFSKDMWPSPSNPSWGAQPFWKEPGTPSIPDQNRYGNPPGITPDNKLPR